jgi:hypothetical protein
MELGFHAEVSFFHGAWYKDLIIPQELSEGAVSP